MSFLKGKKCLVTGGAGFVGTNLAARLVDAGAIVRMTLHDKASMGYKEYQVSEPQSLQVVCDLTRMDDCKRAVDGMDYVFMCAAVSSGAAVIKHNPLAHVTPNIIMNAQMLEAAYHARVKKFVFISSSTVYPVLDPREPTEESSGLIGHPEEVYLAVGWMKRYTEILCMLYSQSLIPQMPTVVVRPGHVYGPHDKFDFETSHVMAALIRKAIERHDPIEVWGTGYNVRDLIYIDDFIDGLLLATERIETYDPINIASGKAYTIRDALQIILEITNYTDAKVVFNASKPSTGSICWLDVTKAERLLGFKAKTSLREGIAKTVEWFIEHNGGEF